MSIELYKKVSPHLQRVLVDGGTTTSNMNDLLLLQKSNEQYRDYLKLSFCPELYGNKVRTSGNYNYLTKGYSNENVGNDLTQTSSANQPYLDKIAPAEKLSAKNNYRDYQRSFDHSPIIFTSTYKWSIEIVLNYDGQPISEICGSISPTTFIRFNNGYLRFRNTANLGSPGIVPIYKLAGKSSHLTFVANGNSTFDIYINGVFSETINVDTTANFYKLFFAADGANFFTGNIYSYHIFSKALSASEVAERSAILRSIFPEIPFTRIGDQIWSVRNFEAVVTPKGNLINEVQSNTTWATSQTLYDTTYAATSGTVEQKTYAAVKAAAMWCHYNNDPSLGAVYGKLYNWFAVKLLQMDIDYYNAANPTAPWGWRVPTQADFNTLATTLGGENVAGVKMKTVGTTYWNSPNTGADNSSGFSCIAEGVRLNDSSFMYRTNYSRIWCIDRNRAALNDNVSTIVIADSTSNMFGFSLRLIKT